LGEDIVYHGRSQGREAMRSQQKSYYCSYEPAGKKKQEVSQAGRTESLTKEQQLCKLNESSRTQRKRRIKRLVLVNRGSWDLETGK